MIKTFEKATDFSYYTSDGMKSGDLYYVEEDKTLHFRTNNIDGVEKNYNFGAGDLITATFTENGTYTPEEADGYSSVTVDVPETVLTTGTFTENGTYTPEEADGYSSVTVDVPSDYLITGTFNENGTFTPLDADGYSSVTIDVPVSVLVAGTFTENGIYTPENADGYSSVTVNVPSSAHLIAATFTENGTYTPSNADGYSSVTVNVPIDYSKSYLTFEARENNSTLSFKANDTGAEKTISYSVDNGSTWTNVTSASTAVTIATVNQGDKILLRGNNSAYGSSSSIYSYFVTTGTWNVYGNIMSLIYGQNFTGKYILSDAYTFLRMFTGTTIVDASNLKLVANTLSANCYQRMFYGCTNLTTVPELPATILQASCYAAMFSGCTSLTEAPELPATTLAEGCYSGTFRGCTSLTNAPELPATTLADYCYYNMFNGCTSLTTAPELPATTLVQGCYNTMFTDCTSLNYIKAMFTTTPGSNYTIDWVNGVAATGTFVKNASATWDVSGASGIPNGWTVQTA